jgi:hypothetical protein
MWMDLRGRQHRVYAERPAPRRQHQFPNATAA